MLQMSWKMYAQAGVTAAKFSLNKSLRGVISVAVIKYAFRLTGRFTMQCVRQFYGTGCKRGGSRNLQV